MTDLDKALAAAREAIRRASFRERTDYVETALRDLIAALDTARGEAVATVQTITSLVGETRKCIIGRKEVIDSLPVGTAVYVAPPAAAVSAEPVTTPSFAAVNRDAVDAAIWRVLDKHGCNGRKELRLELLDAVFSAIASANKENNNE